MMDIVELIERLQKREHHFRHASEGEYDANLLMHSRFEIETLRAALLAERAMPDTRQLAEIATAMRSSSQGKLFNWADYAVVALESRRKQLEQEPTQ